MNKAIDKNPIWHDTATKLIQYGNKFKYTNSEFERQVGFLLLDVGVETLFRSYLTMPDIKAKLAFSKREEAAKGTVNKKDILGEKFTLASFDELSFHKLVEAVGKVAEPSIDENTLKEVEHYHSIRNKIYHLGEGIIPAKEKFEGYLQLADELLMNLLDKNKETEDTPIEYTFETLQKMGQEMLFGVIMHGMAENFKDFQFNIAVAAEVFAPKITRKSFEKSLKELRQTYGDSEDDDVSIRYESQLKRIKGFQDITYIEIDDIDFIDEILNDITYLYLVILETRKAIDNNDLKEYIKYRGFVDRFIYNNNIENATKEDKEQLRKFQKWASNIESKLNALINNQKPTNHERSEL